MALAYGGGQIPSSGLGNIGTALGTPNAPAAMAPRPVMGSPMAPNAGMGFMGRVSAPPPPSQTPMVGNSQPVGGLASIFSGMNPQHAAAIRGIPQEAMQALHGAGMIHPALMQHLYGNGGTN